MVKINILNNLLENKDINKSKIADRLIENSETSERILEPKFPKLIQIETTNICNHKCFFCAYTEMERKKAHIDKDLFIRIVKECYELGSREIGLFSGAEPMTCKWLDEYVRICKDIGYSYTYISSNGSFDIERYKKVVLAGLDSIKFSVNGGDEKTYEKVHGKNDFKKVVNNIKLLNFFRKENNLKLWLGVSFVAVPETEKSFLNLKDILGNYVDEIIMYNANNQSGQKDLPMPNFKNCSLPFNKAHFTVEGYMRACCNDYENNLAIESIKEKKIIDVWNSVIFKDLRKKHLEDKMDGTLCGKCIRNSSAEIKPLNENLTKNN